MFGSHPGQYNGRQRRHSRSLRRVLQVGRCEPYHLSLYIAHVGSQRSQGVVAKYEVSCGGSGLWGSYVGNHWGSIIEEPSEILALVS